MPCLSFTVPDFPWAVSFPHAHLKSQISELFLCQFQIFHLTPVHIKKSNSIWKSILALIEWLINSLISDFVFNSTMLLLCFSASEFCSSRVKLGLGCEGCEKRKKTLLITGCLWSCQFENKWMYKPTHIYWLLAFLQEQFIAMWRSQSYFNEDEAFRRGRKKCDNIKRSLKFIFSLPPNEKLVACFSWRCYDFQNRISLQYFFKLIHES